VVNPRNEQFNIGETPYPSWVPATLWIVPVKELGARFLIIRVPPVASGFVDMPILYRDGSDRPSLAATIQQHFEFKAEPDEKPGVAPKVRWDGEHPLRDFLFKDENTNSVPLLVEDHIWKDGGTMTYFGFSSRHTFMPVRKESYDCVCDNDHPKEPERNNIYTLAWSFGGWRRCSSVEDPRGIFSFVGLEQIRAARFCGLPCQPPKSLCHLATLIYLRLLSRNNAVELGARASSPAAFGVPPKVSDP
jgi:hypothetical protein